MRTKYKNTTENIIEELISSNATIRTNNCAQKNSNKDCSASNIAVEMVYETLKEFLANKKFELREINQACSKITNR